MLLTNCMYDGNTTAFVIFYLILYIEIQLLIITVSSNLISPKNTNAYLYLSKYRINMQQYKCKFVGSIAFYVPLSAFSLERISCSNTLNSKKKKKKVTLCLG